MGKEQGKAVASFSVLGSDVSFLGRALCFQQPLAASVRGQKYMREGCVPAQKRGFGAGTQPFQLLSVRHPGSPSSCTDLLSVYTVPGLALGPG